MKPLCGSSSFVLSFEFICAAPATSARHRLAKLVSHALSPMDRVYMC